jgi:hypothetical protein
MYHPAVETIAITVTGTAPISCRGASRPSSQDMTWPSRITPTATQEHGQAGEENYPGDRSIPAMFDAAVERD